MRTNVGSSSARQEESLEEKLYIALMREKWDVVVNIFRDHPLVHDKKMADMVMPKNESPDSHYDESRFDTALHWAITNEAPESIVEKLVNEIANTGNGRASQTLQAKDDKGDTPLHCAASRGSIAICRHITCVCPPLVLERNNVGETPLFLAALNGHQQTFLYLHSTCMEVEPMLPASIWKRNDGDTILHFTIRRKHFGQ
ncbi:espin-like [Neltuma alba]|uniref:espin-like n=1 Tax=Neltuma alba TaxID=207710 RepID=UPI0010A590BF|nr:espin-like [Prosopis alba]